ncbi:MAG: PD-(D/E)XK nuclease family protein [Bacteroidales bacterium]|nr:PD-(D/E)XK nuclease family protein [Bacteroidales bacterium]
MNFGKRIGQMEHTPFLKEIAIHLLKSGKYNLEETCVVFPNKRARIYFSKYLGELTEKPVWAPKYTSINELMEQLSGLVLADKLSLIFELYKLYTEITGSKESFDLFYPYSETILADFDEIDKYLVDAGDMFQNLSSLKSIEGRFNYLSDEQIKAIQRFWNTFDPDHITAGQETFLTIWKVLPDLYEKFRRSLESKGLAYEGMAYRIVNDKIRSGNTVSGLRHEQYLFIGFNALNTCEEKLFRYMKNLNKAGFFYDYDTWYTNNDIHEAGFFIRKNLRDFPPESNSNNENLLKSEKHITFLPVPSNTGQVKAISSILKRLGISSNDHAANTAIVLADESILLPVLYSLPPQIKEVNITMGYPADESAAFSLIDSLYELLRNTKINQQGVPLFYRQDVLSLINNPLLLDIYAEEETGIRKEIGNINLAYIPANQIPSCKNANILFNYNELANNTSGYLVFLFEYVIRNILNGEKAGHPAGVLQVEALYQVYTLVTRMHDNIMDYRIGLSAATYFRHVRKLLRNHHIPFSGEPLAGLQVMGILETRTIDFENVIMLSMNEGIMPKMQQFSSFIPYSLRYGFGLPTPEHHDSIYAYYFYRLLQRAKNIFLLYNCNSEGLQTGERSRFLHQLYYEFPVDIEESSFLFNVSGIPVKKIEVLKNERILKILHNKYLSQDAKILTPSAVNEFLNCSLKFYFHHVTGLPQPDEVVDTIDGKLFGNLLHKSMKILYESFESSYVDQNKLSGLLNDHGIIHKAIEIAFNEEIFNIDNGDHAGKIEGFNLLIKQILHKYILQIIKYDITMTPFEIVCLEQSFQVNFPVKVQGIAKELMIGGIIDRIDRYDGLTRILDYKTGRIKNIFPGLEALFDNGTVERNDAVLQVLIYALVYDRLHPGNTIVPGIFFIRESHKERFTHHIKHGRKGLLKSFADVKNEFQDLLSANLSRIFDAAESFNQTENLKICAYCPYARICHRQKYD